MFVEKTYTKDNIKMTYYELGKGPTLLFIHGAGLRSLTYKKTLTTLSKHFHIYAPDVLGFGKSDMPPRGWTITDYASYLNSFLIDQKAKSVILLGHSLGGRIALELASQMSIATHLFLIDSSPLSVTYSNGKYLLPKLIYNTSLEILIERNPAYAKIAFDILLNLIKHKLLLVKLKKILFTALKTQSLAAENIKIPTLILWGNKDRIIKPIMAYELQKEIKNSEVKIIEGNHGWCFTKPDLLTQEVIKFINP